MISSFVFKYANMKYAFSFLFTLFGTISAYCGFDPCTLPSICPKVISREVWRARKATDVNYALIPVNYTIIHHTATPGCKNIDECAARIRSMQNYHIDELEYGDIGYNFLIGGDGNVYEGRGWHRVGAHTKGFNSVSIGIAFIGNYSDKYPTEDQINAAKDLIQCAVQLNELFSDYKLYGARQISSTNSPGNKLYREVQTWPHWSTDIPQKTK